MVRVAVDRAAADSAAVPGANLALPPDDGRRLASREHRNLDALLSLSAEGAHLARVQQELPPNGDWRAFLRAHGLTGDAARRRLDLISPESQDRLAGLGVFPVLAPEFPEALAAAGMTLPGVFARGDRAALEAPCIGIVGTRHATPYGKACAMKFAEAFVRAGVTVVSGGAVGIDAAAHQGALDAGGRTIACVASGIDIVYPQANAALFERIPERGLLLSMFAGGTPSVQRNFLTRNGLIAALSLGVLVVEAPQRSGSMNTAGIAGDLGREVFVVPGTIERHGFEGSHALLRDGATFVTHPDHVLEALGIEPVETAPFATVEGVGGQILAALSADAIPIEKIVERTGLDASEVLAEMTMLELDGRIVRGGGGYALKL